MLKKSQRLTTAAFNEAFAKGRRKHGELVQLIHSKDGNFHGAIVVGKKVFKKAVARNRLRRQIYDLLYRYSKSHPLFGTYIIIAKPPAAKALLSTLKEEIEKLIGD